MNARTEATISQLEKSIWFSNLGKADTTRAIVLGSMAEAIEGCLSPEWENLRIEAANQLRLRISERSVARMEQWNVIVDLVKPVVLRLVKAKLQGEMFVAIEEAEDSISWDILHLCMEAEYADLVAPGFYAANAYWYMKGHLPCGWSGEFPNGVPVIY